VDDLADQQRQKIGVAVEVELGSPGQLRPDRGVVRRKIGPEKRPDLVVGHCLNVHLRNRQFLAAEAGAVIEAATGVDDSVAILGRIPGEVPPESDQLKVVFGVAVGHLVEGVEQQQNAPLLKAFPERRAMWILLLPLFSQPVPW